MKLACATFRHMAFDAEWKFRCEADLVARFERIAVLERRNPSDLSRLVFEDYVAAQERAMNLTLRDAPNSASREAAKEIVAAAAAHIRGATSAPRSAGKPATYHTPRHSKKKPTV